ncbi:hypothetical protein WN55_03357 [Dufourea novaeangliae]|uniref:Uncharacterized protein n=1 Tax=Dufourea novaeangliae TaxID=178035 RepID=A0A154PMB1_DUFNO|nr:hypothetical protein WN55_03357 [Dufourea novaeangliae]
MAEKSSPGERNSVQSWAEGSVWSMVCAMELGLISEPCLTSVSFATLRSDEPLTMQTNIAIPKEFPPITSSHEVAKRSTRKPSLRLRICSQPLKKPTGKLASVGRRGATVKSTTEKRNVYGDWRVRELDRARNSTVEDFWKSCKRKPGRPRKQTDRDSQDHFDKDLFGDKPPSVDLARRRTKRKAPRKIIDNVLSKEVLPKRHDSFDSSQRKEETTYGDATVDYQWDDDNFYQSPPPNYLQEDTSSIDVLDDPQDSTIQENNEQLLSTSIEELPNDILLFEEPTMEPMDVSPSSPPSPQGSFFGFDERTWLDDIDTQPLAERIPNRSKCSTEDDENYSTVDTRSRMFRNEDEYHDIRRVTRGSTKITKENFVGKLVWGCCSGWWPGKGPGRRFRLSLTLLRRWFKYGDIQ